MRTFYPGKIMLRNAAPDSDLHNLLTHLETDEFIRQLIKNPKNAFGKDGSSLIDVAARQGDQQALLWLIALDITETNQDPLYLSISNEQFVCSNILIATGANIESAKQIAKNNNDEKSLIALKELSLSTDLILSLFIWGIKNNINLNSHSTGLNLTIKVFTHVFGDTGINNHLRAENFLDNFFGLAELAALKKEAGLVKFYYEKCNGKFRSHADFATVGYHCYVNNLNSLKPLINADTKHVVLTAQQLLENNYQDLFLQCHEQMGEDQKEEFARISAANEEEKPSAHNKILYRIGKYNFVKSLEIYTSTSELWNIATYAYQRKNYVAFDTLSKHFVKLQKKSSNDVEINALNKAILMTLLISQTHSLIDYMNIFPQQLHEILELNFSQPLADSALYQLLNQQLCNRVYEEDKALKILLRKVIDDYQISQEKFQEIYCNIQFHTNKSFADLRDVHKEELKSLLLQYGYRDLIHSANTNNQNYFDRLPHEIVEYMFNFLGIPEKNALSTTSFKFNHNKINHSAILILQFQKQMLSEIAEKHFYEHLDLIFTKNNLWLYVGQPSLVVGGAALLGAFHFAWYLVTKALIEGNRDWAAIVLAPLVLATVCFGLPVDAILLYKLFTTIKNYNDFAISTKEQLDNYLEDLKEFFQAPIMKKRFLKIPLSEYSEDLQLKAKGLLALLNEPLSLDINLKTMQNKITQIEERIKAQKLNLRFFSSAYKQGYSQQVEIKVEEVKENRL